MKKGFFEEVRELLKKINNNQGGATIQDNNRQVVDYNSFDTGYVRMTDNGTFMVTKEQTITEIMSEIKSFLQTNKSVVPECQITDEEWQRFLEIAYDYFQLYQLNSGFNIFMMNGINYVLINSYVAGEKVVTLEKMLENFEIPLLPFGVAEGMIEAIRKDVYMNTRKDNTVDFLEYKRLGEKGRHI